jgi:hypothetical protein
MNRNTLRTKQLRGMRNMKGLISFLVRPTSAVVMLLVACAGPLLAETPSSRPGTSCGLGE